MATVLNNEEDKNQQPGLGGPLATSTSALAGGGPQAPAAAPRQGSSSRPNVNQYLQANQGAGQRISQGIQQQVKGQAGQFEKQYGQAQSELTEKANPLQQELGEQGQAKIQTAFQDPQKILQNQQQLTDFQRLRDLGATQDIGAYQQAGEQALGGLQGQQQKLANQAAAAQTESGRFGLLRQTFGQPTYNRGQQKLDQLFLQAQPGAARGLQQTLRGIEQGTGQKVNQFGETIGSTAQNLSDLAQQRAKDIQNLFKGGIQAEDLESELGQRGFADIQAAAEAAKAQAPEQIAAAQALQERLRNNQLTSEDIQALGLQAGQKIYNIEDLGQYLSPEARNLEDIGLSEFTSPEEYARYQALRQLSAAQDENILGTKTGQFNPYTSNISDLQDILKTKQAQEADFMNQILQGTNYFANKARGILGQPTYATPTYESGLPPLIDSAAESLAGAINGGGGFNSIGPADKGGWAKVLDVIQTFQNNPNLNTLQSFIDYTAGTPWNLLQNLTQSGLATDRTNAKQVIDKFRELQALNPNRVLLSPELRQSLKSNETMTPEQPLTYPIKG